MEKISINLLPLEYATEEIKRAKFYKVQLLGVVAILLVVFFTSLAVALRILQSQNIREVQTTLSQEEERVSRLKDRQTSLLVIKNRLSTINQYLGVTSKQVSTFNLLNQLLPPQLAISSLSVNRSGDAFIVALAADNLTLDNLVSNLISKDDKSQKISQMSIDTLTRGRDGIYRISFKLKMK